MNNPTHQGQDHREFLKQVARKAMAQYGLLPDFSPAAIGEAQQARPANAHATDGLSAAPAAVGVRDLRNLLWCSIDNDDSMDIDQLTVSATQPDGAARILVAIADVDALVAPGSAIDQHARQNTTSVYTPAEIFPMLPERLSTDLTSLAYGEERPALVADFIVDANGSTGEATVYRALVVNRAKLAYNSVAAWLDGQGPMPAPMAAVPGMAEQIRAQDEVAQRLRKSRHERGALDFQTIETRAVFDGNTVHDLSEEHDNRAHQLIEDFMIAANGATARFLQAQGFPSIRRVVRSPERWDRLVALAGQFGVRLPAAPDSHALSEFLTARRAADPIRFPDLSLSVIKLLGSGEYVVEGPNEVGDGHFGLAVKDYTHSTAPNRRFPDLVTQRLIKAALARASVPYNAADLGQIATHCTDMEDEAHKVERLVKKAAAALLVESQIGRVFDAIVTGASTKGTWVRIFHPPVEGRLERGFEGLDVGDRLRVRLIHTDAARGFIDFARA
jgi:VacB/RNase II family 3'-5' exoribonuclease